MQSERFVQHSIKRSKGSTNPYVLFSDLCDYEIDLPNIETQKRLAEVLWTMDEVRMAYKKLIAATDEQVKSQFIENIQPLLDIRETVPLDRLIEPDRPITYGILKPGIETHDGVPVVKVKDIRNGRIDESDLLRTSTEIDHQYRRSRLRNGDLLISIRGTVGRIAEVPKTLENANITQDTARLSIKADYNKTFVRGVLESAPIQRDMEKNIRGVAVKGINIGYLRQLGIPLCKRNVQDTLAQIYVQADKSKFELEQALSELTTTYKRIISEQLG
jgi:type I restriction enzyme S subunit